jgi:hypothetical protein
MNKHNDVMRHNATITGTPVILFRTESMAGERATLVREILGSKLVRLRKLTPEYLTPGTPEHSFMEAATTEQDRATLKAVSLLRYAHGDESETAASALRAAAEILLPGHPGQKEIVKPSLYASLLTREMAGAKLVMWTSKQREIIPAVMCPSLKVALFVASAYRTVASCANCHKLFGLEGTRADGSASEKYCTQACGQRFRQRMYRLNLRQSKSKRKGKQ